MQNGSYRPYRIRLDDFNASVLEQIDCTYAHSIYSNALADLTQKDALTTLSTLYFLTSLVRLSCNIHQTTMRTAALP